VLEKRLCVLGKPIAHSRSPAIHGAALAALGMADEWSYEAIEVTPKKFAARVRALPGEGFVGANVTIPHKHAAFELADEASQEVEMIGAANTLSFSEAGIRADNTDAVGFLSSLSAPPARKRALVLGAGGAARAIVWALTRTGARVRIWNRTRKRARALAEEFRAATVEPEGELLPIEEFDLIVNATSVGLEPAAGPGEALDALHLDREGFRDDQVVVDLVYGPQETELLAAAAAAGAATVDGLEILVRQGAASFRIWTGIDPPLDVMRHAARS
jgi:shikimate dehydrogenase